MATQLTDLSSTISGSISILAFLVSARLLDLLDSFFCDSLGGSCALVPSFAGTCEGIEAGRGFGAGG